MPECVVFVDTETGGVGPEAPIIQIGAVAAFKGKEVACYEAKLLFDLALCEPEALEMNSYNPELWEAQAVPEIEALRGFSAFLSRYAGVRKTSKAGNTYHVARLSGFNSTSFDFPRLRERYTHHELFFPGDYHSPDVIDLAYWLFTARGQWPESCKMEVLCKQFDVPHGRHDALGDARACAPLARKLLHELWKTLDKVFGEGEHHGRPSS